MYLLKEANLSKKVLCWRSISCLSQKLGAIWMKEVGISADGDIGSKYGLDDREIRFIEEKVKEME